jgi:hypothetical protein
MADYTGVGLLLPGFNKPYHLIFPPKQQINTFSRKNMGKYSFYNALRPTVFLLLGSILIGCGAAHKVNPITKDDDKTTVWLACPTTPLCTFWLDEEIEYINPYTYNPTCRNDNTACDSFYKIATDTKKDGTEREQARNELQAAMLGVSERAVSKHMADMKATETNVNLLFGAATSALTGGATVAGEVTARTLTAAATGTNAARSLFTEQVYRNALTDTLISAIQTDRKYMREQIEARRKLPIDQYDVESAIMDAKLFHEQGSFYHGLSLIKEASEKAINEKKDNLKENIAQEVQQETKKSELLDLKIGNKEKQEKLELEPESGQP